MSNDSVSVSGPVTVEQSSKELVAYNLMRFISGKEPKGEKETREYWLTLYRQCYKAANGDTLKYILEEG
jgi:hypothetical protein